MGKIEIKTTIYKYDKLEELLQDEQNLILAARKATVNAYAPYSNFKVGVALLLENGEIITGTNQENAAYPSGLCAERTAIFWSNSQHPNVAIVKMAISASNNGTQIQKPISPCGACRQVMIETESRYKTNIKTLLDSELEILVFEKANDFLPLYFTGESLLK